MKQFCHGKYLFSTGCLTLFEILLWKDKSAEQVGKVWRRICVVFCVLWETQLQCIFLAWFSLMLYTGLWENLGWKIHVSVSCFSCLRKFFFTMIIFTFVILNLCVHVGLQLILTRLFPEKESTPVILSVCSVSGQEWRHGASCVTHWKDPCKLTHKTKTKNIFLFAGKYSAVWSTCEWKLSEDGYVFFATWN